MAAPRLQAPGIGWVTFHPDGTVSGWDADAHAVLLALGVVDPKVRLVERAVALAAAAPDLVDAAVAAVRRLAATKVAVRIDDVAEVVVAAGSVEAHRRLVAAQEAPVPLVRQLADDPERSVREALARRPGLDDDIARRLAHDPDARVRTALTVSDRAHEIRDLLAHDPEPSVRAAAVLRWGLGHGDPDDPSSVVQAARIRRLRAGDAVREAYVSRHAGRVGGEVAAALATNAATPGDVLRALVDEPGIGPPHVNVLLAHPNADPDALMAALDWVVARGETTKHPISYTLQRIFRGDLDVAVVEHAASSADPALAGCALACPTAPERTLRAHVDGDPRLAQAVARNPNLPSDLYEPLARHREVSVRRMVALSPDCPHGVLALLGTDAHIAVREAVASNVHTPPAVQLLLGRDAQMRVAWRIAGWATDEDVLREAARHGDAEVRHTVARNQATPADVIDVLCGDPDARVAHQAAGHPRASEGRRAETAEQSRAVRAALEGALAELAARTTPQDKQAALLAGREAMRLRSREITAAIAGVQAEISRLEANAPAGSPDGGGPMRTSATHRASQRP